MNKIIGIIGFGNMGSSIASRIKNDYQVLVFDKEKSRIANPGEDLGTVDNLKNLLEESEVVLLAVKPQDFDQVLKEMKGLVKDKLVISIAAGITTEHIEKILGIVRVIRSMPNMPARIGKGITCITQGKFASEEDLDFAQNLFDYVGETLVIEEKMMNQATAISGSGPGFFFDLIENKDIEQVREYAENIFIPSLCTSAEKIGFNPEQAELLAKMTGLGSVAIMKETKLKAVELKKQVASKGGTTEAGLDVLHKGGNLEEAVKAALKRAEELSKRGN